MNIDELFIKSESGRSSSLLASLADEELSERPNFNSIDDWKDFFKLRIAENAHPEMRRLIIPLQKEFENVQ